MGIIIIRVAITVLKGKWYSRSSLVKKHHKCKVIYWGITHLAMEVVDLKLLKLVRVELDKVYIVQNNINKYHSHNKKLKLLKLVIYH